MSSKVINITTLFSSNSLITRQTARDLFEFVSHLPEADILLDFAQSSFASRSFFNELISFESKLKLLGKKIEIINLNENLSSLLEIVRNSSKTMSSVSYTKINNAGIINI